LTLNDMLSTAVNLLNIFVRLFTSIIDSLVIWRSLQLNIIYCNILW
jgi:hypothetical protein